MLVMITIPETRINTGVRTRPTRTKLALGNAGFMVRR
jgi:hypothetical protein